MKILQEGILEVGYDELDLLAWNVVNEVVNGFVVKDFEGRIGSSLENFKHLALKLRAVPNGQGATLALREARLFKNALAITLEELGEDEFQTRTGHNFGNAKLLLKALDDATN
jgi:hypothetical protein